MPTVGKILVLMDIILGIDYLGTFVFALSGVLVGIERKFDLFGVLILGFVAALGGGTLRDVLIGSVPVAWMKMNIHIFLILATLPICYFWKGYVLKLKKGIFLFDTIGLGLFTVLGIQKTLDAGLSTVVAIMMGIVTAVFGGVIRDVLANRTPIIFLKEIYASACLIGAVLYIGLNKFFPEEFAMFFSILAVIGIRILAVKKKWHLPFIE